VFLFFGATSCSTKKNTTLTRIYHNTTGRFNIYFNGNESYEKAIKSIESSKENYIILLPVFKNEREDIKSSISGDMDEAIKKSVKMIKMHSITVKPERKASKNGRKTYQLTEKEKEFYNKSEYNKYVDDAYLLIGMAHYYKGDYQGAMRSLHLILNKFRNEPIKFDALYWIARSHSAEGSYNEAENYLKLITEDITHPKKLNYQIDLAYADIYIKQEKYHEAIKKLDYLIKQTKNKKNKARLTYLTAQLFQKINKGDEAIKLFESIIKMNPVYEMVFNAKINMAKAFLNSSESSEKIRKILAKMLKDDKNIDFQDQIYYVFAGIELKENNEDLALNYYKKSISKSVSDNNQKALSYLALADIYFKRRTYLTAGAYYDSTMSVLDKKYPDYDKLSKKTINLKELTDNLKLINHEDSLQRIAQMDSSKRIAFIQNIINTLIAKERAAINSPSGNYDQFNRGDYNSNEAKGKWYFYNPQALSIGRTEFQKIWGKIKLEDNWRRKNKQIVSEEIDNEEVAETDSGRITDNKKIEFYLQDLPLNDSLRALSDKRIAKAYFDAGVVYERKMEDYPEATKSYETLIKRFPNNELILETYFNLYLLNFNILKNSETAETYRNKILNEFPHSKYANILSDPNYLTKLKENKETVDLLYSQAYNAYKKDNYNEVIAKADEAHKISDQNHLEAKFQYLKALSTGSLGNVLEMKKILETMIINFPEDEITTNAKDAVALINSGKYDPHYYTLENDSVYYYMVITSKSDQILNDKIKYILLTHNAVNYPKSSFKLNNEIIGDSLQILLTESFSKFDSCLAYKNSVINSGKYNDLQASDYRHTIISNKNLQKLKKLPIIDKYLKFYQDNY
jgi:tetratricopeptide (TPR) repeat protein